MKFAIYCNALLLLEHTMSLYGTLNVDQKHSMYFKRTFPVLSYMVFGLAEVRKVKEKMLKLKSVEIILHLDSTNGQRGARFLVHKDWMGKINAFTGLNERISILKIQLWKNTQLIIMWRYIPTALSTEEDSDQFYEKLSQIIA